MFSKDVKEKKKKKRRTDFKETSRQGKKFTSANNTKNMFFFFFNGQDFVRPYLNSYDSLLFKEREKKKFSYRKEMVKTHANSLPVVMLKCLSYSFSWYCQLTGDWAWPASTKGSGTVKAFLSAQGFANVMMTDAFECHVAQNFSGWPAEIP